MSKFAILISFGLLLSASWLNAQDMKKFNLYKPAEDASAKIELAVATAGREGKHVLIQVGGNWCIWCARFHEFITKDSGIDSIVKDNYIVYHLNYSPENENDAILAKYEFPQRFGFPVFLVLDGKGRLLHTQNSVYLEDGKSSYVRSTVLGFLKDWSPGALDPKNYK